MPHRRGNPQIDLRNLHRLVTLLATMKLTYFGHSCFGVELGGTHLLFDPFITPNELASKIELEKIPADFVLISHGHADHLADAEAILSRTGAQLVSNWEIVDWFGKKGFQNALPMNHGGSATFPFGKVKYTPAVHSSGLPDGSYGGNPGGFLVQSPEGSFYYSGDTALTMDMKLLAEECAVDFAVLPIGDHFTMGAEDASRAGEFVGTKRVVGVHYDTFPYIRIDKTSAREAFHRRQIELLLPEIGGSIAL